MPHTRAMDPYGNHSISCPARMGIGSCLYRSAMDCRGIRSFGQKEAHKVGEGNVTFTLTSGKTLTIENVRVDSITPNAEVGDVIGVEFFDSDRIVHVPFVSYWEIDYRF